MVYGKSVSKITAQHSKTMCTEGMSRAVSQVEATNLFSAIAPSVSASTSTALKSTRPALKDIFRQQSAVSFLMFLSFPLLELN